MKYLKKGEKFMKKEEKQLYQECKYMTKRKS